MTIPGSICCPNAELPYRLPALVQSPRTRIVVNCAGRTRSIIGAQTLINFGVPNPVYALENGTQGWYLADYRLERGSTRRYPETIEAGSLAAMQAAAASLMRRFSIASVGAGEVRKWLDAGERTVYLCDVRTPEEFAAGSLPGAVHAPGGQLIQATDQWIGVRGARIVLIDGGERVRAPMVASWLRQLGCDAVVLEGGIGSGLEGRAPAGPALPRLASISAAELQRALDAGQCAAIDIGPSPAFRKAHITGSRWSTRVRIVSDVRNEARPVVLVAEETAVAALAAVDLLEAGLRDIRRLDGGVAAWARAGYPTVSTPDEPPDAQCIDYLFLVHDRHAGNREAMRQYLAWETGLVGQLDEQERASFKVATAR
jgi:rhodanese-related sulfurtransferase